MYPQEEQNCDVSQNVSEHDYGINTSSMHVIESEIKQEQLDDDKASDAMSVEQSFGMELTSVVSTTTQLDFSSPNKSSVKKSFVWKFFKTDADKTYVICNICHKKIKFCGNTSSFREHLRRMHPLVLGERDEHHQQEDSSDPLSIPAIREDLFEEPQQNYVSSIQNGESLGPSTWKLVVSNNKIHDLETSSKTSTLEQFFRRRGDTNLVSCNICNKLFKFFGCTTKMKEHIKRIHRDVLSKEHEEVEPVNSVLDPVSSFGSNESLEQAIQEITDDALSSSEQPSHNLKLEIINLKTKPKLHNTMEKKSLVWKYFKTLPGKKIIICNLCKKHFRFFGNTTNLKEHLRRVHLTRHQKNKDQNEERHQSLTSPSVAENSDDLDRMLVRMIVTDYQPLSMIENMGFKNFMASLNPTYNLPSEITLTNELLPKYFNEIYSQLKEDLKTVDYISVTAEKWYSNDKKNYLSIHAHYIKHSKFYSKNLATREVTDLNSEEIAYNIEEILQEFNIYSKCIVVVLSSKIQFNDDLRNKLSKDCLQCISLRLGSVVNEALSACEDIQNIVTMYRELIFEIKENREVSSKLKEKQVEMRLPMLKLKYLPTYKWHFIYIMLERFLEVKQTLISVLNDMSLLSAYGNLFKSAYVNVVEDLVLLLKPLFQITRELSAKKYVIISNIIPLFKCVKYTLSTENIYSGIGQEFQMALLSRFLATLDDFESNRILAKSTFLDPRFKKAGFISSERANDAELSVVEELSDLFNQQIQQKAEVMPGSNHINNQIHRQDDDGNDLWVYFDDEVAQHNVNPMESIEYSTSWALLTVKKYSEMNLLHRKENPLKYWEEHSTLFPELATLAKRYLSIPATAKSSEMLFLKTGSVLKERRNFLESERINEIVFLHSNM